MGNHMGTLAFHARRRTGRAKTAGYGMDMHVVPVIFPFISSTLDAIRSGACHSLPD